MSEKVLAMQARSEYNKSNLSNERQSVGSTPPPSNDHKGASLVDAFDHFSIPPAKTTDHNREEIARQLLPLLQQFMATYSHADLSMTPLGESFRRILCNAQYHAMQGGVE